jgi:O-antigen/teichoic acid export membrane protein
MFTAIIKLIDIAGRSLFVLIILYLLPMHSSGQFGLALTLIGLFAFLSGFERYVDLQRILVDKSAKEADLLIFSVMRFFGANYLLWLPILALLLDYWVGLSALAVTLCLLIAIGEHLGNEFYRIALITHRYRSLLVVAMIKNTTLLSIVSFGVFIRRTQYDLNQLLILWAFLSVFGLLISVGYFIRNSTSLRELRRSKQLPILDQYRSSVTHFKVGLLAVLSLQADRLIAGGMLSIEDSGIYFRHIFLALSAYQILGVISFNRVMATVYRSLRNNDKQTAKTLIRRERLVYLLFTLLMIAFVLIIKLLPINEYTAIQRLIPLYLILLLLAYFIRGAADFNAMVLNALYLEREVFRVHLITVGISLVLSLVLISQLGLLGLMATVFIAAIIYLVLSHLFSLRALKLVIKTS